MLYTGALYSAMSELLPSLHVVLYSILLVSGVCMLGDRVGSSSKVAHFRWLRAVVDSLTHGMVALLSWAIVTDWRLQTNKISHLILCALLGMAIDVDHFIAARSLSLKAATSLAERPFLHATTVIPVAMAVSYVVSWLPLVPRELPLMVLVAWLSHHLRDATRRGLWFPPIGSTPPLPYCIYIFSIVALALLVRMILVIRQQRPENNSV